MSEGLFRSFYMGGFECSTHRLPSGRRLDLISATKHDHFALQDYQRLSAMGILTARDGLRWHLIEGAPGQYDFSSVVGMLEAAHEAGIEVIWDLLHYGWPDDLGIFDEEFIPRFANFSRAFAELASKYTERPWIVPVNEISFFAWAAGEIGIFNPFAKNRGDELKIQLVRAVIAAIQAMQEINPKIRIVHTEPMINVVADAKRPQDRDRAEGHRQAQYAALDMIAGRSRPELGGREEYLGVIGVNYYIHNQWVFPGGHGKTLEPSHEQYRPVWQMLREVFERYRRPLFVAETGIEDQARPAWLRYIAQEARRAIRAGVPVEGICLYPIVNHPGWDDDRHCFNGLWDYASNDGNREAYEPLVRELKSQQQLQGAMDVEEAQSETDSDLLDVATHWMEIRSGREDILHK